MGILVERKLEVAALGTKQDDAPGLRSEPRGVFALSSIAVQPGSRQGSAES